MIRVSFEVATIAEAEEILQAVRLLKDKPYRMKGFGPPVVEDVVEVMDIEENRPDVPRRKYDRKNVSPGEPNIVKIGESTKDILLGELAKGIQPPAKYKEHLKLLWKRELVMFDGENFYV